MYFPNVHGGGCHDTDMVDPSCRGEGRKYHMVSDGPSNGSQGFYPDDGISASSLLARLQAALDVLKGIFDRLVLHTNVNKTVGVVC